MAEMVRVNGNAWKPNPHADRNDAILDAYLDRKNNGATYRSIGAIHGLSAERVRQIVATRERKRRLAVEHAKAMAAVARATAMWEVLVHNRRVIHDELRVAFHEAGKPWKQKPKTLALMDLQPPPEPIHDEAKEQRRLLNLQHKVKAQERRRYEAEWRAKEQAEERRKAEVWALSHRWRCGPPPEPPWETTGRELVKRLQSGFIENSQHWPEVMLEPGDMAIRDWRSRKLVTRGLFALQYDGREVRRVDE